MYYYPYTAIGIYLNNIKGRIDDLNDANTLDRVLALLTKAEHNKFVNAE